MSALKDIVKSILPEKFIFVLRMMRVKVKPDEEKRAKQIGLSGKALKSFLIDPEGALKLKKLFLFGAMKKVSFLKESKAFIIESILEDAYQLEKIDFDHDKHLRILDVGANVGAFAMAARNVFPHATIHCYEPFPDLEQHLHYQAYAVGAKYFMEGIGPEKGSFSFDERQNEILDSESVQIMDLNKTGNIPVTSLQEAIDRVGGEVDILKLDCEGSEWAILKAHNALKKVKYITLEYHRMNADGSFDVYDRSIDILSRAKDMLKNAGFEILKVRYHTVDAGIVLAKRSS